MTSSLVKVKRAAFKIGLCALVEGEREMEPRSNPVRGSLAQKPEIFLQSLLFRAAGNHARRHTLGKFNLPGSIIYFVNFLAFLFFVLLRLSFLKIIVFCL